MDYNLFRASLITCSTGALASSFKIAVTTFCEGACANPSIVKGGYGFFLYLCVGCRYQCTYGPALPATTLPVLILSFKSTIIRWAVFSRYP